MLKGEQTWKTKTTAQSTSIFVGKASDIRYFSQNIRSDVKASEVATLLLTSTINNW